MLLISVAKIDRPIAHTGTLRPAAKYLAVVDWAFAKRTPTPTDRARLAPMIR